MSTTRYLILGTSGLYGVFATGDTLKQAKATARREGFSAREGYTILHWPEGAADVNVDGMGRVSWTTGGRPEVTEVKRAY